LLCILLCFAHSSFAQLPLDQERYVDSLNNILRQNVSDSTKARANYFLIYYWVARDTAIARKHLDAAKKYSLSSPFMTALYYAHEGYYYYVADVSKSEAALLKADSLLSRFTFKDAYISRANVWSMYGTIQQRKDDDKAYIDVILHKAIPLALKAGDTTLTGSFYSGLGTAFMNTDQFEKAEFYFNKAMVLLESKPTQPSRLVSMYNRVGENYINLHKYAEARKILDKVRVILEPYPESELYAGYYLVEGLYHHHQEQYARAVASFDKGITYAQGANKAYNVQELLSWKSKSLIAAKQYAQAIPVLTLLSQSPETMSLNTSRLDLYAGFAESYAGMGKMDQAYQYQKRYSQLSDSIHETQFKANLNELELKYRNAENQNEIITLKAKNEQAAMAARNSKLWIGLLTAATLLLLILVAFALLYYRNNKRLLHQKELNHRQQLKELEQQQRIQFGQAVLKGEEQERRRLARDLHDGLGGMLAGVKINLSGQVDDIASQNQRTELQKIIEQLDNSVTELRRIAHNMMPVNLLKFGLETALKDLCESLMNERTRIDFQAYSIESSMPEQTQINIYRIVQEMLANAVKHADATNIILQCSQNGNTFLITQEDNGKGFDTSTSDSQKGIGLSNIRNRVGFLKGKMEIESVINEGTTINIELHVGH
jgi:signal transduction histidine kinase